MSNSDKISGAMPASLARAARAQFDKEVGKSGVPHEEYLKGVLKFNPVSSQDYLETEERPAFMRTEYNSVPVIALTYSPDGRTANAYKVKGMEIPFSTAHFKLRLMWVSQPGIQFNTLEDGDYSKHFKSVFIVGSARKVLMDDRRRWEAALEFVASSPILTDSHAYFIGIRKTRMVFADKPFTDFQICRAFAKDATPNRLEHLIQLITASGFPMRHSDKGGMIALEDLKIINTDSSDGLVMGLTPSDGAKFGLVSGLYQIRSVNMYSKGTLVVSEAIEKSFINKASIKVKNQLPEILRGEDFRIIASSISREKSPMRASHQDLYCLGTAEYYAQQILHNVKLHTLKDDGTKQDIVSATLSAEIMALRSLGFPAKHMQKPDMMVDAILRASRPVMGNMCYVAMLRKSECNLPEGWYAPDSLLATEISNLIDRSPRMAIGGAFQLVEWERDDKGKLIYSPITGTILLVVDGEPDAPNTEKSKVNFQIMMDMGADVDGDMLNVNTPQSYKLRKASGLIITKNVPVIKAKDSYPNTDWTDAGRWEMSLASNPRLMLVGSGDLITRDARDLYLVGILPKTMWDKIAWYGANIVQEGVSAPKYYFKYEGKPPKTHKELVKIMEEENIGRGCKMEGVMYDAARNYILERLDEIFPETAVPFPVGRNGIDWKGGYVDFLNAIATYSPEVGENWVTHVRRCFYLAAKANGITQIKGKDNPFKDKVVRMIAKFIRDNPDRQDVWTWLLKPDYFGLDIANKYKILGMLGMPQVNKNTIPTASEEVDALFL